MPNKILKGEMNTKNEEEVWEIKNDKYDKEKKSKNKLVGTMKED